MLSKRNPFAYLFFVLFLSFLGLVSGHGQEQQELTENLKPVIKMSLTDWMMLQKALNKSKTETTNLKQQLTESQQLRNQLLKQQMQLSEQLNSSQESEQIALSLSDSLSKDLTILTKSSSELEKKIQEFLDSAMNKIAELEQKNKTLTIIATSSGIIAIGELAYILIDNYIEQTQNQ